MLNHKPKEAVAGAFVRRLPTDVNDSASESGLAAEDTALGRRRGGIRPCGASSTSAKMIPLRRIPAGRGVWGPAIIPAAPRVSRAHGVFFWRRP